MKEPNSHFAIVHQWAIIESEWKTMPAKDIHHDAVRRALEADGWKITNDPLRVLWQNKVLFMDLGAEPVIAAEKEQELIAVEIKTFTNPEAVNSIHSAVGQYIFYRSILKRLEPNRILYLAIPVKAFEALFDKERVAELLLRDENIRVIVFDPDTEEILQWLEP